MSSIFLTNLEKNYQKINNYMNLIFLSIFLLISLLFFLIIYMYLKFEDKFEKVEHKMENIELKQEKEYQHLLKNVKYVSNFLEENLNKKI